MKRIIKRLSAGLLALLMMGTSLPAGGEVFARNTDEEVHHLSTTIDYYTNPLYEKEKHAEWSDLSYATVTMPRLASSGDWKTEYVSVEKAVIGLREQLKQRASIVEVKVHLDEFDSKQTHRYLFQRAIEHTGVPTEGDYLRWQYGGYTVSSSAYSTSEGYFVTYTYYMQYYTTAEQEAEMDVAVDALLGKLISDGMTDYEKLCAVYDWMCESITYDYENLEDSTYMLKHSAYAALIDRTSVCQGYAVLLYRLMLELGIDCRLIDGYAGGGHAWNIIYLDGKYYNADSTWDATMRQAGGYYQYFLRGDHFYLDHSPNWSEEFQAEYPVSATDYVPAEPHVHKYAAEYYPPTCISHGFTVYTCYLCGEYYYDSDTETPFAPHQYGEWIEVTPAQVGIAGSEIRVCIECNHTETRVIPAIEAGRVPGDIDGDGAVTEIDLTLLRQYLCGIPVIVENPSLDTNGDGQINMRDVAILAQYLAGMAVELR